MQGDIIELIDTLVRMAGGSSNYESLSSELEDIKNNIAKKELALQKLKDSMTDDKYFDASSEIVDRNIEISINKKIKRLKNIIANLDADMDSLKEEEATLHQELSTLKKQLDNSIAYIEVINMRLNNAGAQDIKDNYKELLSTEETSKNETEMRLENKQEEYEGVAKKLEALSEAKKEMAASLNAEQEKLKETKENLNNPNTYIDEDLRKSDEEQVESLVNEIEELDQRRLGILTNPTLIANDVKELVAALDKEAAYNKLKELITLVKTKPYMNEEDRVTLESELANLNKELASLTKELKSKKYNGNDVSVIEERIHYLENIIELKKINIDQIRENITIIDTQRVSFIRGKIEESERVAAKLEEKINEYEELISHHTSKTDKKASNLKSTIARKRNELATVNEIIASYKDDLRNLIEETFNSENVEIKKIEEEIKIGDNEITKLKKLLVLDSKSLDEIEREKDLEKVSDLKDKIEKLNNRLSFDKSPNEIFDEVEMILGSIGYVDAPKKKKVEFQFDPIDEEPKKETSRIEIPEEPDIEEEASIDEEPAIEIPKEESTPAIDFEPQVEAEPELVIPEFEEEKIEENSNRIKVIDIIPLEEDSPIENEEESDDYRFDELEDTNYFSFDDALNKAKEE